MDLSIIIVNWKSAQLTRDCVSSIRSYTRGLAYEIIVVDNASPDDSVEVLRQTPGIRLIASSSNLGFAGANNLGVSNSEGRFVLFLNPDTLLVSPAIDRMFDCLNTDPAAGAAGCRLLNADLTLQTACVQPFPTILNQFLDNEWIKSLCPRARLWGYAALFSGRAGTAPIQVEAISGACLMVPRSVFDEIAGFSTDYFMYGEDIDLCYKIRNCRLKIYHVPDATIIHYGGQSSSQCKDDAFGDVVMRESIYMFLHKTRGAMYARAYKIAICCASLLRLAVLVPGILAILAGMKNLTSVFAFRRWVRILKWSLGLEDLGKFLPSAGVIR